MLPSSSGHKHPTSGAGKVRFQNGGILVTRSPLPQWHFCREFLGSAQQGRHTDNRRPQTGPCGWYQPRSKPLPRGASTSIWSPIFIWERISVPSPRIWNTIRRVPASASMSQMEMDGRRVFPGTRIWTNWPGFAALGKVLGVQQKVKDSLCDLSFNKESGRALHRISWKVPLSAYTFSSMMRPTRPQWLRGWHRASGWLPRRAAAAYSCSSQPSFCQAHIMRGSC